MAPPSHKHGHGAGNRSSSRPDKRGFQTWFCCNCNETLQSLVLNDQCTNPLCQHTRCASCSIDGNDTGGLSFPRSPSPSGSRSSPLDTFHLSKETIEKLALLDQLKSVYKATFDEAAKKHEQESFASASDSGKSILERYLQDLIRPTEFVFAWEWSILPFLVEIVPKFLGRGYAINVTRDPRKKATHQTICLTGRVKPTRTRRLIIARHVLDVIPDRFHDNTSFQFCHGTVEFIQRGTDKKKQDDVCDARNPHFYLLPMMGDSIGPSTEECAATLGPCLKFGDHCFWLANLHVFLKQLKSREANAQQNLVLHPGLLDKDACGHSIGKSNVKFGTVCASSGNNLTTTRPSSHPFWKMFPKNTPHDVVTDWVLIDDHGHTELAEENNAEKQKPLPNTLRIPTPGRGGPYITVTEISPVLPEAKVRTTGRTSGHQFGQICEIPAYLDADAERKTTKPTREWYVEQPSWVTNSEEDWLEGGIGVPGDSGAPVVDSDNDSLYGQIWGRNHYWGPGPRVAYFTAMSDISKDIQEKYPQLQRALELPQQSSRKRDIQTELYCPKCAHPGSNGTPQSTGDGSDEMSIMSISSTSEFNSLFDDSPSINALERNSADGNPPELRRSDTIQSDSDELIGTDSRDAHLSYSPIDPEEFEELLGLLPPASHEEAELEMALDPYQFYGDLDHDFGVNDETLSIDDDGNEDDDIPARSFAAKKNLRSTVPREKFPGSWVMVCAKPNDNIKRPSKVASKKLRAPRKNAYSVYNSFMKTTEASGRAENNRTHANAP